MASDFENFAKLVSEKSPKINYQWTRSKENSCRWMIDKIRPGAKGLDVGGTDWLCRELEQLGCDMTCYDLYPVDNFPKSVQGDMSEIMAHFPERSFDFITTRHTLEHSLAPLYQLYCYNRLLKDGGKLYVIVPDHVKEWVWYRTHYSCLPRENWLMLFKRAGFKATITDAGTWNSAAPEFIEHRFQLTLETRELQLSYAPTFPPL